MIVAELRVVALGEGTSQERAVEEALRGLEGRDLRYEVGPLGTAIETENLDELLHAVRAAHARLRGVAQRVVTELTIEERLDVDENLESSRSLHGAEPERLGRGARAEPYRTRYPAENRGEPA